LLQILSVPAGLVIAGVDKLFIGPDVRKQMVQAAQEAKQKKNELW